MLSYEDAAREATQLIERDGWFVSFDRLAELRQILLKGPVYHHSGSLERLNETPSPL